MITAACSYLGEIMRFMLFSVKIIVMMCSMSLSLTSLVHAEPLIVGLPDNPPFVTKTPNGEVTGRTVNQMKLVLDRAGINYKVEIYPLAELTKNFGKGKVHITMTRGRSDLPILARLKIEFGKNPFVTMRYNLYSFKGLPTTSLADVKGKKLITVQGAPPPDKIKEFMDDPKNKIITNASPDWNSAVQDLFAGRGDYLIMLPYHFDLLMEQNPDLKQKAKAATGKLAFAEIIRIPIFLGISKSVDDAENLIDRLDHAIEQLRAEGTL
jgi:ABC-type amino acid transport substrate-binding protein